jgi:crossover junction endodeoxyribonuclease RuvC
VKILGIDPGVARTGWGIVKDKGGEPTRCSSGCIETPAKLHLQERLTQLYDGICRIIKEEKPSEAAVEQLYFKKNVKTALAVGHARGVVLLAIAQHNIPIFHYNPLEIKVATTGYGKADKTQVQKMMKALLSLKEVPEPDDVADALAVAVTHL